MAAPFGPYRYDKPSFSDNGGITFYGNDIRLNGLSADATPLERFVYSYWAYQPFWLRAPGEGWKEYYALGAGYNPPSALASNGMLEFSSIRTFDGTPVVPAVWVDAGPVTEWYFSWYDPSKPPPIESGNYFKFDPYPALITRTQGGPGTGCWLPQSDSFLPSQTYYENSAGKEIYTDAKPQGVGQIQAVVDYSRTPPSFRLYVCTEFEDETLGPEYDGQPKLQIPFDPADYQVARTAWKAIDLNFPKIDSRTGKTFDQFLDFYDPRANDTPASS